jgi:hypothetical protein
MRSTGSPSPSAAYLDFFAEQPGFVELLIQERAHFRDRKRPTYFEHRDANVGDGRRSSPLSSRRAGAKGPDRADHRRPQASSSTEPCSRTTSRARRSPRPPRPGTILDIVFHGILLAPEQDGPRRLAGEAMTRRTLARSIVAALAVSIAPDRRTPRRRREDGLEGRAPAGRRRGRRSLARWRLRWPRSRCVLSSAKVNVVGNLEGLEDVTITPEGRGKGREDPPRCGDTVKPGEVLLEIDDNRTTSSRSARPRRPSRWTSRVSDSSELPQGALSMSRAYRRSPAPADAVEKNARSSSTGSVRCPRTWSPARM